MKYRPIVFGFILFLIVPLFLTVGLDLGQSFQLYLLLIVCRTACAISGLYLMSRKID